MTVTIQEALSKKGAEGGARTSDPTLSNNKHLNQFFVKLFYLFETVIDFISPHEVTSLVNETNHDEYIKALDKAYKEGGDNNGESNWFDGHLIEAGFDGMSRNSS